MRTLIPLLAIVVALLTGCSSQQLYGAGQAWQRNECQRMLDPRERERCLASTALSYEEYRRQAEEAKRAP
jgi:hypothetical protein